MYTEVYDLPEEIVIVDMDFKTGDYAVNGELRDSVVEAFQEIFTSETSPYDEDWPPGKVEDFLDWTGRRDYEGLLAVDRESDEVIGFSWGYRIEPEDEEIDIEEKFPAELRESGPPVYDSRTVMLDELGVRPEYRDQGIGKALEEGLIRRTAERDDISRAMQRTQRSPDNLKKLGLDGQLGFTALLDDGNQPVTQEVPFVGKEGSDERIYLWRELEGEME